ncbi:MAG TPA: hypothetical protein EYM99_09625 [Alphaproteobacteria bacterium]|nr:hypothetical protein [Chromatiaceae bacterium]HIB83835.1 hypothetical protein [Chromatiaceae bacterium]HIN93065.1 hypothetical protein [Alphaproteobacteria bacterium]
MASDEHALRNNHAWRRCCGLAAGLTLILAPLASSNAANTSAVSGDLAPLSAPDSQLNVADVVILQRFLNGELIPTPAQKILADVAPVGNPDGILNIADLVWLRNAAMGLTDIDSIPPQPISKTHTTIGLSGNTINIDGGVDSVEADAVVVLTNTRTGAIEIVAADEFGSFSSDVGGIEGDEITVTVTDDFGNASIERTFVALANPAELGPYAVGTVLYLDENGISGITDPTGENGPTRVVNLAWARIMYPADIQSDDEGVPISTALSNYPIALFMHGVHALCDQDGSGPGLSRFSPTAQHNHDCKEVAHRIPNFEGYNYLMELLASRGIFSISISAHEMGGLLTTSKDWNNEVRGSLILAYLDILRDWNNDGSDPFGGIFFGRLDLSRIGLSGHSRGGQAIITAQLLNQELPNPHSIVAINPIAANYFTNSSAVDDTFDETAASGVAFFSIHGSRDGDVSWNYPSKFYEEANQETNHPKSHAFVYGANHAFFNTIWTEGPTNPWAGNSDDGDFNFEPEPSETLRLTPDEQRLSAINTIIPFFQWQLQEIDGYRSVLTGKHRFRDAPNDFIFWTFQDGDPLTLDDFEQLPIDISSNTIGGTNNANGFSNVEECEFETGGNGAADRVFSSCFAPLPWLHENIYECGGWVDQQVGAGLSLTSNGSGVYSTSIPTEYRDVSGFAVLSIRAARRTLQYPPPPYSERIPTNLRINIEDGQGNTALRDLRSDQYGVIPYPDTRRLNSHYENFNLDMYGNLCGSLQAYVNRSQLSTIRIPLEDFTSGNSNVDLTNIVRITIRPEGTENIAIDDIEFSN